MDTQVRPATAVTCTDCGRTAEEPPLVWSRQLGRHGELEWLCETCTREHLTEIEGKLDRLW